MGSVLTGGEGKVGILIAQGTSVTLMDTEKLRAKSRKKYWSGEKREDGETVKANQKGSLSLQSGEFGGPLEVSKQLGDTMKE